MNKTVKDLPPAKWQKTVTIVKCDYVNENVPIMVKQDWSAHCDWYEQHKEAPGREEKVNNANHEMNIKGCQGPLCKYILDFLNKLKEEESASLT